MSNLNENWQEIQLTGLCLLVKIIDVLNKVKIDYYLIRHFSCSQGQKPHIKLTVLHETWQMNATLVENITCKVSGETVNFKGINRYFEISGPFNLKKKGKNLQKRANLLENHANLRTN